MNEVITQNAVTDATQEMLVELNLKQYFCCNSTSISCVSSVTAFCIMTPLLIVKKIKNIM